MDIVAVTCSHIFFIHRRIFQLLPLVQITWETGISYLYFNKFT